VLGNSKEGVVSFVSHLFALSDITLEDYLCDAMDFACSLYFQY